MLRPPWEDNCLRTYVFPLFPTGFGGFSLWKADTCWQVQDVPITTLRHISVEWVVIDAMLHTVPISFTMCDERYWNLALLTVMISNWGPRWSQMLPSFYETKCDYCVILLLDMKWSSARRHTRYIVGLPTSYQGWKWQSYHLHRWLWINIINYIFANPAQLHAPLSRITFV
jgi:hypothetical protein